jgi:hypothetical protein
MLIFDACWWLPGPIQIFDNGKRDARRGIQLGVSRGTYRAIIVDLALNLTNGNSASFSS